jgi:hypothetical protein
MAEREPPPAADGKAVAAAIALETELEKARRHVERGAEAVERQREVIFDLRRTGRSSEEAERLLRTFQDILLHARKHLARLEIQHRKGLD